ncbi:PAAR domain-containing protein [Marinobacter sp. OP 3.4]|uniref:PAAR domain-containing protein n=1 Tax=Marinobacter sp. OP 3.4 TaxID=3076501 RepID=UPI002E231A3E
MGKPMAHLGCYHQCPDKYGKKPHVGGRVMEGASSVKVGGIPVARVGDKVACRHCMDCLLEGVPNILIEGQPVTRIGSMTTHAGTIVEGNPTVSVGDYSSAGSVSEESALVLHEGLDNPEKETASSGKTEYDSLSTDFDNPNTEPPPVSSGQEVEGTESQSISEMVDQPKEKKELIIEVMGKEHPKGHLFRIFDESDNIQKEGLEKQVQLDERDESVLHKWDWTDQQRHNIWLEIETESGAPIRLPAINQVSAVEEQTGRQKHVIFPVVPSTLISGVSFQQENPRHHVLCRSGYLYLFKGDELWRELEIEVGGDGKTCYRDVPLQSFRNSDGEFEHGYRDPTGVPLEEIWIPARLHGAWQTIGAAYSESQWPGERINYYQGHARAREDRSTHVRLKLQDPDIENGSTSNRHRRESHILAASILKPQRPRNFIEESRFDRPEKFIFDTSGAYFDEAMKAATDVHQRQEDQGADDPVSEGERPEMAALSSCLFKTLNEVDPETPDAHEFDWEKPEASSDSTKELRSRKIGVIRVDDPLYRIRYLQLRYVVGSWYAGAAVQRAKAQEHFKSAILVNRVFVPEGVGGKTNPLHEHLSEMDDEGKGLLAKSIASSERRLAIQYLRDVQNDLLMLLNSSVADRPIEDLFTHCGFDYAGAFYFASNLFQQLTKDPLECDALATVEDSELPNHGKRWLNNLMHGAGMSGLYFALFPLNEDIDLENPYEEQEGANYRPGTGRFRGPELASLENADLPDLSSLRTLDGLQVVALAKRKAMETVITTSLRAGAQALMTIHGSIWGQIYEATEKAGLQKPSLTKAKRQLEELENKKQDLIAKLAEERRNLKEAQRLNDVAQSEIEQEQDRLRKLRTELDLQENSIRQEVASLEREAITTNMRIYSKPLASLRASLPENMGQMHMMRLSKALESDYLIVGFSEEYKEELGKRFYGDINVGDDVVASTNKNRAEKKNIQSKNAIDVNVLVVPRTKEFIKRAEAISRAQTQYLTKENSYQFAEVQVNASQMPYSSSEVTDMERAARNAEGGIDAVNSDGESLDNKVRKMKNPGYRALNGPVFPIAVLLIEGLNVKAVASGYNEMQRQRGTIRARAGSISATFDIILTGATVAARLGYNAGLASRIVHPLATGLMYEIGGRIGLLAKHLFGGPLLVSGVLGIFASFLAAGICFSDAAHAYQMGNTAVAIGHGLLGTGTLLMGIAGIAGKGGLLILGPIGWAVLALAFIGAGAWLIWRNSDNPLEIWMRHGPFGKGGNSLSTGRGRGARGNIESLSHLKDANEAYYRLVSLISSPTVYLEDLSDDVATRGQLHRDLYSANAVLRIGSPVISILGDAHNTMIKAEARLRADVNEKSYISSVSINHQVYEEDFSKFVSLEKLVHEMPFVVGRERNLDGLKIYVKLPDNYIEDHVDGYDPRRFRVSFGWDVKLQIVAKSLEVDRDLVFPAPKPEDSLEFKDDVEKHSVVDFDNEDQDFWYYKSV